MKSIYKNLNYIIVIFFLAFIFTNQFSVYSSTQYISYFFILALFVIISIYYYKKEFLIKVLSFENVIFFFTCIILIFYYWKDENILNIKMFTYFLIILLITNLIYQKKDIELIFKTILILAILFLIIAFVGFFYGGEGGAWGSQYLYVGYRYLPSTKNEDGQIFLLGYVITFYFIFEKKMMTKYLILNSLFAATLFLTYSRGYWLIYVIIFIIMLFMTIFYKKVAIINFTKLYALNIIFIISIILILNPLIKNSFPNGNITLQGLFLTKINSIVKYVSSNINYINNLERTSVISLSYKVNEFTSFFFKENQTDLKGNDISAIKKYMYKESSILFLMINLPLVFFMLAILFIKKIYILLDIKKKKTTLASAICVMSFIYVNTIYNFTEDSMNYLYLYTLLIFDKLNSV